MNARQVIEVETFLSYKYQKSLTYSKMVKESTRMDSIAIDLSNFKYESYKAIQRFIATDTIKVDAIKEQYNLIGNVQWSASIAYYLDGYEVKQYILNLDDNLLIDVYHAVDAIWEQSQRD